MIKSAGLLMCRNRASGLEFFLVHPGGPFFAKKNEGVWSIPKGLVNLDEELMAAAQREFFEETGITPTSPFQEIGSVKLSSGKIIYAWTFLGEWESSHGIVSNTFEMEWPPKSGRMQTLPEVDRAEWMSMEVAKKMINANQIPFLRRAEMAFGFY